MDKLTLTQEEQDALLQVIVKKIPTIREPDKLHELVNQALELMLRRPEDHELKVKLIQCVQEKFSVATTRPSLKESGTDRP